MQTKRALLASDIERLENTSPVVGLLGDYTDAATWTCPESTGCCETSPQSCTCPETQTCPATYTCPQTGTCDCGSATCDCGSDSCCCEATACITGAADKVRDVINLDGVNIDFVGF